MRTPTESELQHLLGSFYDPAKAHAYYLRTRKLHPRQRGAAQPQGSRTTNATSATKTKQKHDLQAKITNLQIKLRDLEALIQKKEAILRKDQSSAKSTAKKERAAKEKNKPKTAAEKAKAARENKKFRDKHRQQLKIKAKQANKSGGGSSPGSKKAAPKTSIADLKTLATKVKGQIAVAKQKLAAL